MYENKKIAVIIAAAGKGTRVGGPVPKQFLKIGGDPVILKTLKAFNALDEVDHIFIVTNEHPMDIYEARDLCASYGLDSAMAFDGGSSTSLNYKNINVVSTQSTGDTGRALKSFMVVKQK